MGPCCGLECGTRGLPCTFAMFRDMEHGLQEDEIEPTALPESTPPIPPPVCGPACETGSCNSMCKLVSKSRGRFRRARRAESLGRLTEKNELEFLNVLKDPEGEELVSVLKDPESEDKWVESNDDFKNEIEMESPDAHQNASSTDELGTKCGDYSDAISELLRNLGSGDETCHQNKAVQTEAAEEELEEDIEGDDAEGINYREFSGAFQLSLRAQLLNHAQPNNENDVSQQMMLHDLRWGFNTKSFNDEFLCMPVRPLHLVCGSKTRTDEVLTETLDFNDDFLCMPVRPLHLVCGIKTRTDEVLTETRDEDLWKYEELPNDEDGVQSETRQNYK